jgi:hypothetical protein
MYVKIYKMPLRPKPIKPGKPGAPGGGGGGGGGGGAPPAPKPPRDSPAAPPPAKGGDGKGGNAGTPPPPGSSLPGIIGAGAGLAGLGASIPGLINAATTAGRDVFLAKTASDAFNKVVDFLGEPLNLAIVGGIAVLVLLRQ